MGRAAGLHIVAAALLSAATLGLFAWDGRFAGTGGLALDNLNFEAGLDHWSGTPGFVGVPTPPADPAAVVGAPRGTNIAYLARSVPEARRYRYLRIAADIRLDGVVQGDLPWKQAGIWLRGFDDAGRRLRHWPYRVVERTGTADWQRYQAVIAVPDPAGAMILFLYNAGAEGRLWVRDIAIDGAAESGLGRTLRYGLAAAWAVLVLSAAVLVLRRGRSRLRWAVVALGGLILASTLAPQPGLAQLMVETGRTVLRTVETGVAMVSPDTPAPETVQGREPDPAGPGEGPQGPEAPSGGLPLPDAGDFQPGDDAGPRAEPPSREAVIAERVERRARWVAAAFQAVSHWLGLGASHMGHIAAYGALAVLCLMASGGPGGAGVAAIGGYLFAAAVSTEVMQSFVTTRGSDVADLVFNVVGIALGLTLAMTGRWLRRRPSSLPSA